MRKGVIKKKKIELNKSIKMHVLNQIVYIGTGQHINPVKDFPETLKFIFIDVLPRSEWDSHVPASYEWYRHQFYAKLVEKFNRYGFTLISTICLDKDYAYYEFY